METENVPRTINVNEFVEQRAVQVAHLLQMVDNSKLVSGEVTKGPRTAAQRLPRHMRRRAMSYNVKRFPKGLRLFATPYLANSKHRKKPPSRYFRRRPKNALLNYIRRQKEHVWLETHIWHAKRFHMCNKWGYRIPDRSFQRNFRPCYRDSTRKCTIRDKSYLNCFVISHKSQEELIKLLSPLCSSAASPTFAFKSSLDGRYEISTLLFEHNKYPHGFIAPARFQWAKEGSLHKLILWIHPSSRQAVLNVLLKTLDLQKVEKDEKEDLKEPKNLDEWLLMASTNKMDKYANDTKGIEMTDLRDQLVRFRLYGPSSLNVLSNFLKLAEGPSSDEFCSNHEEWTDIQSHLECGDIADGSIITLLIEDPRISRPTKKENSIQEEVDFDPSDELLLPKSHLWNDDLRKEALTNKLSPSDLQKLNSESIGPVPETPAKVPIQIVVRNLGSGRSETLSGCEIVAPSGFGLDLWISCQLSTARASGNRDDLAAHLEAKKLHFPNDSVDSAVGSSELKKMEKEFYEKYNKKPHNRRVQYWTDMSVKHPFSFHFDELLNDWTNNDRKEEPFVIRDRRVLLQIERILQKKEKMPADLLTTYNNALLPVELNCVARGRPKRFGLICLPTKDDLTKVNRRHLDGPVKIIQKKRGETESSTESTEIRDNIHQETDKKAWQDEMWKNTVSLDPSTREKPIPLKPLFPDNKVVDKKLKRKMINRKKKELKKRRKLDKQDRLATEAQQEEEMDQTMYKQSCSRLTIGRVVRGDYSFKAAKGLALGYIPMATLPEVLKSNSIVLLRNSTSRYYHPAKLTVLHGLTEL